MEERGEAWKAMIHLQLPIVENVASLARPTAGSDCLSILGLNWITEIEFTKNCRDSRRLVDQREDISKFGNCTSVRLVKTSFKQAD
jgi:hypothetical protein